MNIKDEIIVIILLLFIGGCQKDCRNDVKWEAAAIFFDIEGIWIPININWEKSLYGIEDSDYAGLKTLRIYSNGKLKIFEWLVYKRSIIDTLVIGAEEGRHVYLGTWKVRDDRTLSISFRLVYAGIREVGEKIPGNIVADTIAIIHGVNDTLLLKLGNQTFQRTRKFDSLSIFVIETSPTQLELEDWR